jgi:hypothetical protein
VGARRPLGWVGVDLVEVERAAWLRRRFCRAAGACVAGPGGAGVIAAVRRSGVAAPGPTGWLPIASTDGWTTRLAAVPSLHTGSSPALIAHAAPGTSAHDGLRLLASWAAEPATSPGDQGSVVETFILGIS